MSPLHGRCGYAETKLEDDSPTTLIYKRARTLIPSSKQVPSSEMATVLGLNATYPKIQVLCGTVNAYTNKHEGSLRKM